MIEFIAHYMIAGIVEYLNNFSLHKMILYEWTAVREGLMHSTMWCVIQIMTCLCTFRYIFNYSQCQSSRNENCYSMNKQSISKCPKKCMKTTIVYGALLWRAGNKIRAVTSWTIINCFIIMPALFCCSFFSKALALTSRQWRYALRSEVHIQ